MILFQTKLNTYRFVISNEHFKVVFGACLLKSLGREARVEEAWIMFRGAAMFARVPA
jgi:hypothetical protein